MTLHLIPEPEEKASELLRDLTANDNWHANSLSWPGNQRACPSPNSRQASCFWPATPYQNLMVQQRPPTSPAQQPSPPAHQPSVDVKALDYLVAINDISDNPAQKWVINESILASLTGCFRPAIKKFVETHHSFINQANNTHGLGPGHNRGKARVDPGRYLGSG
jgi:hypothetical protein